MYSVVADGKSIYESPVLRGGGPWRRVSLSVVGVRTLVLRVADAGDGQLCESSAWGDVRVIDPLGRGVITQHDLVTILVD